MKYRLYIFISIVMASSPGADVYTELLAVPFETDARLPGHTVRSA